MSTKHVFQSILLIYLALAVIYSAAQPLGETPDEADHYAYIVYLGQNRRLPEGPTVTQSKHPPLYYATAAALTAWTGLDFDFLRSNPDALPLGPDKPPNFFVHTALEAFPWQNGALAMHLARLLSLLLGAVTIWAAWRLGEEIFPERPAVGLLAAAFLAGLPGFLAIAASVSNDSAAAAFGALTLLLCIRILGQGLSWRRSVALGLVLGLGLLSKVGTLAQWPLVFLAVGGAWWLARPDSPGHGQETGPSRIGARSMLTAVGHLALSWGLGLLAASPWLLRNWRLYGDPMGWELVRSTVDQRLAPLALADIGWLLRGLHRSFWVRFGAAGQAPLPDWAYWLFVPVTLLILAGAIRWLFLQIRHCKSEITHHRAASRAKPRDGSRITDHGSRITDHASRSPLHALHLLLLGLSPLLVFASIVSYSALALGTDQARLMFPAIAAIAVWVGVGVVGLADWLSDLRGRDPGFKLQASSSKLQAPSSKPADRRLILIFTGLMTAFGLAAWLGLLRPAFAPPQPVAPAGSQAAETLARFGEGLMLVGVELPAEPLVVGQPVAVRLLWQARQPLADDLRPALRLVHNDGWLAAEWSHSPAGGRYATDRWQPGEIIADDYLVAPQPPGPGVYRVEVGVRPFGGDWLAAEWAGNADTFYPLGQVTFR